MATRAITTPADQPRSQPCRKFNPADNAANTHTPACSITTGRCGCRRRDTSTATANASINSSEMPGSNQPSREA